MSSGNPPNAGRHPPTILLAHHWETPPNMYRPAWYAPRTKRPGKQPGDYSTLFQYPDGHGPTSHWISFRGYPLSKGNKVILSVLDRFSKLANFVPLPKLPSAKEMVQRALQHAFRLHGLLVDIVSGWGPQFILTFWREFFAQMGTAGPDWTHQPGAWDGAMVSLAD